MCFPNILAPRPFLVTFVSEDIAIHSSENIVLQSLSIIHGNSGQLRGDLVAEAEKPPLPWELTRLGAHAALRTKQMAENGALQGAFGMLREVQADLSSRHFHIHYGSF